MVPAPEQRLELLFSITKTLTATLDFPDVLLKVVQLSTKHINAERGMLFVLDEAGQLVDSILVIQDKAETNPERSAQLLNKGLAGWVKENHKPVLIENTRKDKRCIQRDDDALEKTGAKSAICVPLVIVEKDQNEIVGILTIIHPKPGYFNESDLHFIQAVADVAAIAVRNAHLHNKVQTVTKRYQGLFEGSPDAVLITDQKGNILETNSRAEEISGYFRSELVKMQINQILPVDIYSKLNNISADCGREIKKFESTLLLKDGQTVAVDTSICPFEDFFQWVITDISERKELNSLQDDLMAMIYHDLRAPLANIVSSLDMLQIFSDQMTDPAVPQLFGIANRSTERLQRMINSLLDIYQLESGQALSDLDLYQVNELVVEAVEIIRPLAENKNQMVKLELNNNLPAILLDEDMIRRVIINLVENATKFMGAAGEILIGTGLENDRVLIWVKDSGPGISDELIERIFEKFSRLKDPHLPKGVGLGLAFCKLAVEAHAGSISVKSQLDQGSCFTISLPLKRHNFENDVE